MVLMTTMSVVMMKTWAGVDGDVVFGAYGEVVGAQWC
jgi:hypothetical protein